MRITFRTRKAAQKWLADFPHAYGCTIEREANDKFFSRTGIVWVLVVPEFLEPEASKFFPATIINQ